MTYNVYTFGDPRRRPFEFYLLGFVRLTVFARGSGTDDVCCPSTQG